MRTIIALALLLALAPTLARAQIVGPVTPRACGGVTEVTTGGTAVTAVVGPINGGFIYNPPNAASQGIATAEDLFVDMVNTPGGDDATGNGTTSAVPAGLPFYLPPLRPGVTAKVNAASDGHLFTANCW